MLDKIGMKRENQCQKEIDGLSKLHGLDRKIVSKIYDEGYLSGYEGGEEDGKTDGYGAGYDDGYAMGYDAADPSARLMFD